MSRPISSESAFRAVADPTRRRIIDMLRARESSPADMNQSLRIKPPVLSFHLRVLTNAGMIVQRRRGRDRVYRLLPQSLAPITSWMRTHESRALALAGR
jgi:DNA-binding transcriptional ArsR family regulator